jgi:hypothetical protein
MGRGEARRCRRNRAPARLFAAILNNGPKANVQRMQKPQSHPLPGTVGATLEMCGLLFVYPSFPRSPTYAHLANSAYERQLVCTLALGHALSTAAACNEP